MYTARPRHHGNHPLRERSPMTPRTKLGTDQILDALVTEGLGHLFMVPGGLIDPFLPALTRQEKIKPIIAAHEGGAVYMADGYAHASGRFGAALGIGGPGACNMATAVAAAKTDGSPVLVMTGEVPLDLEDRGAFQDASQATLDDTAVMAPLTRLSKTVATANNLNHWFRHATAAILCGELDCLLVRGSGFNERDTMHWTVRAHSKALMIHVNTDMEELTANGDMGHVVPGSCHAFLDLVHERAAEIAPALTATESRRREWLVGIKANPRLYDVENLSRASAPIHPATAIAALRMALPRDGIVLVDSGAHRAFAGHYWTAYEPRTYISATNLGPMGWAVPAAVGVQCARPDRRVAVITGDGCMQMHGIEVQTAARYQLPIVYVVINNSALGNVCLRARQYGALPAELTSIPDHDWAAFARALGAQGFTVRNPADLESTLQTALAARTTALVDVKANKNCPTPVYDFSAGARAWSYHE